MYKGTYLSVWVAELAIFCAHNREWPLLVHSLLDELQKKERSLPSKATYQSKYELDYMFRLCFACIDQNLPAVIF